MADSLITKEALASNLKKLLLEITGSNQSYNRFIFFHYNHPPLISSLLCFCILHLKEG
ncbi:MAG: hypothetical protein ACQEQG_06615 [Bacillota bacterium]